MHIAGRGQATALPKGMLWESKECVKAPAAAWWWPGPLVSGSLWWCQFPSFVCLCVSANACVYMCPAACVLECCVARDSVCLSGCLYSRRCQGKWLFPYNCLAKKPGWETLGCTSGETCPHKEAPGTGVVTTEHILPTPFHMAELLQIRASLVTRPPHL